jgi:lipopolysaccharide export system protein LptA
MKLRSVILVFLIFNFWLFYDDFKGFTQEVGNSEEVEQNSNTFTIESVRMEADLKKNLVVFTDKVVAADKDYTLNSDKLTIILSEKDRDPEKIVAEGRVRIVQENLVSESEKATILPSEDKVILEGNARVRQDGNVFSGKTVEYTRSTGRVVMREGVKVSILDMRSLKAPPNSNSESNRQTNSQKPAR